MPGPCCKDGKCVCAEGGCKKGCTCTSCRCTPCQKCSGGCKCSNKEDCAKTCTKPCSCCP
ncbi:metallothionein-1B-like [Eriocheir sinensis]|uniref:Metallothionein-1 n=1 Tax=Eriocheir sinensis TaxID=95602 RepID=E9K8X5_ERISI|nr:metallothionein-1B-like [Eriocheir sinensis]ADV31336.1 metallothionein-1 [Eriocheir sinensis]ADV31337.1 metallothionein-1 [Eriocheir sinensis]